MSTRQAILDYCARHGIKVPNAFHDLDTVYAIALVDVSVPEAHRLVAETFYSAATVLEYFLDRNRHPANYRVLDFKRGVELVMEHPIVLVRGPGIETRTVFGSGRLTIPPHTSSGELFRD